MDFSLDSNPSISEISDAINYLLGNLGSSGAQYNPVTGTITQNGVVIGYLYRYLWVKYATSFNGSTGFSNSPTNATYYGLSNSSSNVELTNPSSYAWYPFNFGTTNFFYYLTTGGRTLLTFLGTTSPGTGWNVDSGAAIDLDLITSGGGSVTTFNNQFAFGFDGQDGDDAFPIPGPPGPAGNNGANGATGPAGPAGFGVDGEDGQDGMPVPGPQGPQGTQGIQGIQGIQGLPGSAGVQGFDGEDGQDGFSIVGPPGANGAAGSPGPQGPAGPAIYLEADYQEADMFLIPGPQGPAGTGGGGGGGTKGTATIDFGSGKTDATVAVSAPAITTESIQAWIIPATTATNTSDNHWVEDLTVIAGPANAGVGFTIYGKCTTGFAHGTYNIGWVYS